MRTKGLVGKVVAIVFIGIVLAAVFQERVLKNSSTLSGQVACNPGCAGISGSTASVTGDTGGTVLILAVQPGTEDIPRAIIFAISATLP